VPPDTQLESAGAVIGEIRIVVQEIFDRDDPKEDLVAYRLVNRLHRSTRREVIARQLLFRSGDRYSRRVLDESERLLRADRYLHDVDIRPVAWDGDCVAIEVDARDVWTLNLGASLGRAGGESSTRFEVQDTNLLGTGKSLTAKHSTTVDRTTDLFRYDDPAVLGSRFQLELDHADTSDGGVDAFELTRPFFSLDTRWAGGFGGLSETRADSLYRLGEVSERFGHRVTRFEVRGGRSRGLVEGTVTRWTGGFTFQRDRFTALEGEIAAAVPPGRTLAYPWVGWDWQRDAFRETANLDQMGRTEDVLLGPRLHARLGLSAPAFGADRGELVFDATGSVGTSLDRLFDRGGGGGAAARHLLFLDAGVTGRWSLDGLANTVAEATGRYYWRDHGDDQLYVGLEASAAHHLDPERQLLLGGDSGLRGYPLRYQSGGARALLTVEQRVFTPWYPYRLVRIGMAAFWDAGRVWGAAADADLGLLQDVGVGLRIVPTRSGRAAVVHLDLAVPLGGPDDIAGLQWLLSTRSSF
jgi:hypothetical protein